MRINGIVESVGWASCPPLPATDCRLRSPDLESFVRCWRRASAARTDVDVDATVQARSGALLMSRHALIAGGTDGLPHSAGRSLRDHRVLALDLTVVAPILL